MFRGEKLKLGWTLLLGLGFLSLNWAQDCHWTVPYDSLSLWTFDNAGNQLVLGSNRLEYRNATDGQNRRLYRELPQIIEDSCWRIRWTFTPQAGGVNGVTGHLILGLTQGNDCPLNTCNSINSNFTNSTESGILVSIGSERYRGPSNLRMRLKWGTQVARSPKIDSLQWGQTYFLQLEKYAPDSLVLSAFIDSNYQSHYPGSPSIAILDSALGPFRYLQHSTFPQGHPDRKLTAELSELCYSPSLCGCSNREIWSPDSLLYCPGDSLALQVPPGFQNFDYQWSTGSRQSQIWVEKPGSYELRLDSASCTFRDTLRVVKYPSLSYPRESQRCLEDGLPSPPTDPYFDFLGPAPRRPPSEVSFPYRDTILQRWSNPCDTLIQPHIISWKRCQCDSLLIPNVFTPNGDGRNDVWSIRSFCNIPVAKLSIWDRRGRAVFESEDLDQGWNGKYQGQKAPAGTYFFVLKYRISGNLRLRKGFLTLMR